MRIVPRTPWFLTQFVGHGPVEWPSNRRDADIVEPGALLIDPPGIAVPVPQFPVDTLHGT